MTKARTKKARAKKARTKRTRPSTVRIADVIAAILPWRPAPIQARRRAFDSEVAGPLRDDHLREILEELNRMRNV